LKLRKLIPFSKKAGFSPEIGFKALLCLDFKGTLLYLYFIFNFGAQYLYI